jgi:hypothetical protein
MSDNIKYHPKSYALNDELIAYFTEITNDKALQQELYNTNTLLEVATIGQQRGFKVTGAHIIKAQAGRALAVIQENTPDINNYLVGVKPETGGQWGRGGQGYLDKPGYWLQRLADRVGATKHSEQVKVFLQQCQSDPAKKEALLHVTTFNQLAELAQASDSALTATQLLEHQAETILLLSDAEAEEVASQ